MVTESDTESIQVEVVPSRYLMPATAQKLLNAIYEMGDRQDNHPRPQPSRSVPYGPGRGVSIEENRDLLIEVAGQAFELCVKVGRIRLELESKKYFDGLKAACERALPISFQIRQGKFFHTRQTITDYAKFGNVEDTRILGLDRSEGQERSAWPYCLKRK